MRLGELKNIIACVLDKDHKIQIDATPKHGNQLYEIKNYGSLMGALQVLKQQGWNKLAYGSVEQILTEYGDQQTVQLISAQEYTNLRQYVSQINPKIPVFYGMLETMVEAQDEKIINIRLPEHSCNTLAELNEFNKDIDLLLKTISVDGDYKFEGFDVGTSWYEILIIGLMTYRLFVGAIDLAQHFFVTRERYYKSEEAKIHYQAAMKKEATDEELREYVATVKKLELRARAKELMKNLDIEENNHEVEGKIVKTVEMLEKQMEQGTEFHLSLNPPTFVQEQDGKISINYEQIRALQTEEAQQIEDHRDE